MTSNGAYWELYRKTSIGETLCDTLDEKVQAGEITDDLARRVIATFDHAFEEHIKQINPTLKLKGNIVEYKYCSEVWTFLLQDVVITTQEYTSGHRHRYGTIKLEKPLRIVACNHIKPGSTKP